MAKKSSENRRIVLELLNEADNDNVKFGHLLKNVLDKYNHLDKMDKAFITRLSKGCVERRITLDYIISIYAKTGNKKIKPLIRNVLRMAIYQIIYMDSVKDFAAVSEAVELVKERGLQGLTSFVNGVLRTVARQKDSIPWPDKTKKSREYLSVMYSIPEWLVVYFLSQFSFEEVETIFKGFAKEAPVTIRINGAIDRKRINEIIEFVGRTGIKASQNPYYEYAFDLEGMAGANELPGFTEGLMTIQDVSSQLDMALAGIKPGDRVLDMCAAPGGKTMHASLLAGGEGQVDARDISEAKLDLIRENATRLHRNNISFKVWDASEVDEDAIEKYDVVVLDAPCSGIGVIGRKADIRYHISENSINELSKLQKKMIDAAVKYVKKGGTLIYSTCTISKKENEKNRDYIINNHGFKPYDFSDLMCDELKQDVDMNEARAGYMQLLPGKHKADGFFISRYTK